MNESKPETNNGLTPATTTAIVSASGERRRRRKARLETPPLLQSQERFLNRWLVDECIGRGGFGQIFIAADVIRGDDVAIKVEMIRPNRKAGYGTARRMVLEQTVFVKLQGKPHVPKIYASGHTEKINFIVMQCLSVNLSDLRRKCPGKRIGPTSAGRVMVQLIDALRDIHEVGFVHRDVKPANICFGINPENSRTLYLLDFGMARRFLEPDGSLRRIRQNVQVRGTKRYISPRVHRLLEQSPYDDMFSAFYSLYELVNGSVPWAHFTAQEEVFHLKNEMIQSDYRKQYFENELEILIPFLEALLSEENEQGRLDYEKLKAVVKEWYTGKKNMEDSFEWEEGSESNDQK